MKNLKTLVCIIICAGMAFTSAANEPKKVSSKIDKVTVFLQGAQIVRSASVSVPAGTTDLIFEDVSPNLNTGSLQAGGRGNFVIMGVRYNTEYTPPGPKKENAVPSTLLRRIELTRDSLQSVDFDVEMVNYTLQAWTTEKNMLERNKLITGEGKTDSLALFIQAMEYYRKKIHEINQKIIEVKMEQKNIQKLRNEISARLTELVNYKSRLEQENVSQESYSYQVIVTVSAKAASTGTVSINYLVNNASWIPTYELRAENSSEPVVIHYKAMITQSTGEDWKNVNLVLSTLNPQRQHAKPTLVPWVLRYYQPPAAVSYQYSNMLIPVSATTKLKDISTDSESEIKGVRAYNQGIASSISAYTQQIATFSNVEFEIELPYTIPSDGKSQQVTVMEKKAEALFKHYTVPKIETEAFLVARLTGWEEMNLLPGTANVYFQNTIIGSTQIDPGIINDTLNISLGRDQGISVTRKKLKDKEVTRVLSNNIEKEITIEISLRNRKNEIVDIQVEDQLPVSAEQDIKVKVLKEGLSGATNNEQDGTLIWNLKLAPRESKTFTFTYTISYPKDKNLPLQ